MLMRSAMSFMEGNLCKMAIRIMSIELIQRCVSLKSAVSEDKFAFGEAFGSVTWMSNAAEVSYGEKSSRTATPHHSEH